MKKLSEIRGEDAIDLLVDIIDPVTEICGDEVVAKAYNNRGDGAKGLMGFAKVVLKEHKKAVIEILAVLEGVPVDEYINTVGVLSLPVKILEILNDEELVSFFYSQVDQITSNGSGSATEIIKEIDKK